MRCRSSSGRLLTSATAVVLSVPVAVGLALLLNQVRGAIANPLATFVDILAAIPSVVYGLWGLFVLKPFFDTSVEPFLARHDREDPRDRALFSGNSERPRRLHRGGDPRDHDPADRDGGDTRGLAVVPRDQREAALALGRHALGVDPDGGPSRTRGAGSWARRCSASAGARRDDRGLHGRRQRAEDRRVAPRSGRHDPVVDREQLPRGDERRAAPIGAPRARRRPGDHGERAISRCARVCTRVVSPLSLGQTYPSKPIKVIIASPPGILGFLYCVLRRRTWRRGSGRP